MTQRKPTGRVRSEHIANIETGKKYTAPKIFNLDSLNRTEGKPTDNPFEYTATGILAGTS